LTGSDPAPPFQMPELKPRFSATHHSWPDLENMGSPPGPTSGNPCWKCPVMDDSSGQLQVAGSPVIPPSRPSEDERQPCAVDAPLNIRSGATSLTSTRSSWLCMQTVSAR